MQDITDTNVDTTILDKNDNVDSIVIQKIPDERTNIISHIRQQMGYVCSDNHIPDKWSGTNDTIKQYLKQLYVETMFKKKELTENISILFDPTTGHLIAEYIGYKGTDFYNGQYFILFELPDDYPKSPPKISVLTESGRFYVKQHLSLSITHFHRELWYPMPLVFLIINMLSVFPDYSIYGIGHMSTFAETTTKITLIKELTSKTREYNERHYPILCESFKKIRELKDTGSEVDIQKYIDEQMLF